MKKIIFLTIFSLIVFSTVSAQNLVTPDNPARVFSVHPGYITINELTGGPGIAGTGVPYADYQVGITTMHGYMINENFVVGGGTGVVFYNKGMLLPVFADFRYNIHTDMFTPYIYVDAGFLFNVNDVFKKFVNPGVGVRYSIQKNLAATAGIGMWSQFDSRRDSFISFKLGLAFKPK